MNKIIRTEFDFEIDDSFFWTDGMIVLGYVRNVPRRYHTIVANRFSAVQEYTLQNNGNMSVLMIIQLMIYPAVSMRCACLRVKGGQRDNNFLDMMRLLGHP